jgi:MYXO-CTERM domain-containing protein
VVRDGLTHVTPKQPVAAGTELVFEADNGCTGTKLSTSVHVKAESPLPTNIGTLSAATHSGPVSVPASGVCYAPVAASYADLTITLSAEARPFADLLRYELRVDGAISPSYPSPYNPQSDVAPALDRVYALCARQEGVMSRGLAPGKHRVQIVGILPNDTRVASNEVEVELVCSQDGGVPDASVPQGGNADGGVDAAPPQTTGNPDAGGTGGPDAGNPAQPGTDARTAARAESDSGCSLSAGSSAASGNSFWTVALALGGLFLSRKRRV